PDVCAEASYRPRLGALDAVAAPRELLAHALLEAAFELQRPRPRAARVERLRKVLGVEHRRVDRLLRVEAEVDEREEEDERPLVLLVAPGRAERECLALSARDRRRQRRARPLPRRERSPQAFLQPEHRP